MKEALATLAGDGGGVHGARSVLRGHRLFLPTCGLRCPGPAQNQEKGRAGTWRGRECGIPSPQLPKCLRCPISYCSCNQQLVTGSGDLLQGLGETLPLQLSLEFCAFPGTDKR